jgi:hypothetical protein
VPVHVGDRAETVWSAAVKRPLRGATDSVNRLFQKTFMKRRYEHFSDIFRIDTP